MNAEPFLARLAAALNAAGLEAILIGNAAAALHGAPVTTLDFDFLFRDTPVNRRKLKKVATALAMTVFRPYYPASRLYRLSDDAGGPEIDFMARIHGVRSFEGLKKRGHTVEFGGATVMVADLADVIARKRAAGRDRDLAVLPVLEKTLDEKKQK